VLIAAMRVQSPHSTFENSEMFYMDPSRSHQLRSF
jgi:hypothetical protein